MVAVIEVLSGDVESYKATVYKAKVLTGFKGVKPGEKLFFGPFISYGVGSQYLAFLKRVRPPAATVGSPVFGELSEYHAVMYQGYSIMPIDYECVFEKRALRLRDSNQHRPSDSAEAA